MAEPSIDELKARIAELEKQGLTKRSGNLEFRVSEKGGVSVYGLGRFPVTLYYKQWNRLLGTAQNLADKRITSEGAEAAVPQGFLEKLPAEKPVMREISSVNSTSPFDELFLAHYPRLVSILRRMLGNSGRAEELATDVFLKFHRRRLPAIANGNIPGWMY